MTVVLHRDGTTTRTAECRYCGTEFGVSSYGRRLPSYCSQRCGRGAWRLRKLSGESADIPDNSPIVWDGTTLYSQGQPLKDAWEATCMMCGRTAGPWWYTPAEARRHTLVGLERCTACGGATSLQAAYGRSRAAE